MVKSCLFGPFHESFDLKSYEQNYNSFLVNFHKESTDIMPGTLLSFKDFNCLIDRLFQPAVAPKFGVVDDSTK
jgi:hypothetical protein